LRGGRDLSGGPAEALRAGGAESRQSHRMAARGCARRDGRNRTTDKNAVIKVWLAWSQWSQVPTLRSGHKIKVQKLIERRRVIAAKRLAIDEAVLAVERQRWLERLARAGFKA